MNPASTYAVVTFLTGILLMLGWVYVTADHPRAGALFRASLWLFLLPIAVAPWTSLQFPLAMWAYVACEEGLKTFAAWREKNDTDRFLLISLFGLWELTLDKPFWGWMLSDEIAGWSRLELSGLVYATALPVLMHCVTAAVYAFRWRGRLWAAFLTCWIIHTAFNESVAYFYLSLTAAIAETAILLLILIAALPRHLRPSFLRVPIDDQRPST